MMFGLFGKKKERRHPVILDLSVKEKPDGWDELTRLGFEPVFVNHRPRPNGISGDYVQTRWRLKANPDVTCTVYDSWEGGGGATFLDFDAPWNPQRIHGGCNLSWPNYTLDRLHSLGKVLFEGDRSEFEEPDSGNLDLRGITPDPVREKMRELGLRMERDDSHDSNGDDSDEEYWCKYDQGELLDVLPCLKAWDSSINAMLLVRVSERLRPWQYSCLGCLTPCFHARPRPGRI